ncbi:hypothetical protein J5U18_02975 [Sphingobacteriaceae bacterium WQ 2009]|uniref:Uncharacterized protein n=1 Tax=Rhinopithecimicrobium faecis TaxID=2820698 RepID=A0A8T4H8W6_9SPHI|nr:hypothetical protein [Sphingobacteriaceae bacterium WQ 2009]
MSHSFHIPVLGLAFSIDTPLKVAQYGISSVVSIVDDTLIERMRAYYCEQFERPYIAIDATQDDARALRITAYLNLMQEIIDEQLQAMQAGDFENSENLNRYFALLPEKHPAKLRYQLLKSEPQLASNLQKELIAELKASIKPGNIDVNIMAKVDKLNFDSHGLALAEKFSDALAAIRGFAQAKINSSVVLSAGLNPKLYSYIAEFPQFIPHLKAEHQKFIILKVSDFRSAFIQAKFLAKKGLWVSEFRIESGLNCGGHAFATEGLLLGPILEEFKAKRTELLEALFPLYKEALAARGLQVEEAPAIAYTYQGGIGTAQEHEFLLQHYQLAATGWGSPFLLVPEVTAVDSETIENLIQANAADFYVSGASPLGVPFNNFRQSTAEKRRLQRIQAGRPGNPCKKKYLVSNTEFTAEPICTASRQYQQLKIKELETQNLDAQAYEQQFNTIVEKTCLCEGLATPAYLKYHILQKKEEPAVSICPGPNIAYFKSQYSLDQMVNHIYGRTDLLNQVQRPLFFINELNLYIEHLTSYVAINYQSVTEKKEKYVQKFKAQLLTGIQYYENLKNQVSLLSTTRKEEVSAQLQLAEQKIKDLGFA